MAQNDDLAEISRTSIRQHVSCDKIISFLGLAAMEDTVEISKGPRLSRLEDKQNSP